MPENSETTTEGLDHLRTLRRAERSVDPELRHDLGATRDFIERLIGPTVSRAAAARLLGVSHTGLDRWVERGEISTVLTPAGRREVPVSELVELLDDLEALEPGPQRLARAIRERQRRATEAVDLDKLLPRRRRRGHRVAELHSLAYHRLVADRLDEQLVNDARRRLQRWREEGRLNPRWAEEWESILARPLAQVARAISADTKHARQLRQTSPFAGALTEQERKLLLAAVEERALP
jgi:hypothetical protein